MSPDYELAGIDDLESLPVDEEGLTWRPIRRRFGITAFGTNAYTAAKAGERVVEEHTEATNGHEELYLVLRGRAMFTLDGEEVDAPAGTLVYVKPATKRGAVAREDGTTVIGFGAPIGKPFEISKWEAAFAAYGYQRLGDPERALATMRAGWESDPDHWASNYHYACLLALQGRGDEALEKLARAVELNKQAAEWAAGDEDFSSIRDDPRFASAVAGQT
jgi:tetratricopeptide (TPR) repeat protein